jgi:threonine-phosphate decarboxylase
MIEGHGDDAWKYGVAIRADFSSNVRYGSLHEGLLSHLRSTMGEVVHYPEAGAESLQLAAAEGYGVGVEQVLVTNGATEAIYLLAQVFRHLKATIYTPAFAEYEDACRSQGMTIAFRDWEELRRGEVCGEGLVFLCNPNNPTGAAVSPDMLVYMLDRYRDALFVIDESYIEFTRSAESLLPVLRSHPNVLVVRSLTKSCRIPGLRLGFLIAREELISRLRAVKMPWSVNRPAIAAGVYIFRHPADFLVSVDVLLAETAEWRRQLADAVRPGAAAGWRVRPTDTHYFLIDTPAALPSAALKLGLVARHGLLVRDASNFSRLGSNVIRVACQSPEHNLLLTKALAECASIGS